VGQADVAGLGEVVQRRLVAAQQAVGDPEAEPGRGLRLILLAIGDGGRRELDLLSATLAGDRASRDPRP